MRDCEAPLNQIEQAHERVAEELKSFQQEDQQLSSQLESMTAASLSIAPYQPDRLAAGSLVEQAKGLLPADPLGTLGCLGKARKDRGYEPPRDKDP